MNISDLLNEAHEQHDVVYEVLKYFFDTAPEEEKVRFQNDVRRVLLPFDLTLGLQLLKAALAHKKDRRTRVKFLVKYGAFSYDILRFAESYIVKQGIDMPTDEKALKSLSEKDGENLIATLQEPVANLMSPVSEFLHNLAWENKQVEKKKITLAVFKIADCFLQSGKNSEEEGAEALKQDLKLKLIKPMRPKIKQ